MAQLSRRLNDFINSPRGQELVEKAKVAMAKPENQRRIEQVRTRLRRSR